jgi:hypothetical protein
MSNIKKGALVKAWDDDISKYVVGELVDLDMFLYPSYVVGELHYDNAIEIPAELAAQLEGLGVK